MKQMGSLVRRNTKLFFKDKGTFFTSLITPLVLLLLFVTFLGNVYRSSFRSAIPEGLEIPSKLVEGFVGGWLLSSLLATSCVTVAFCSNMLQVQDKVTGARKDLTMAPVKSSTLALSYLASAALSTLLICSVTMGVCMLYLGQVGWYLSAADVMMTFLDILLLVSFGSLLSSIVSHFLSTQGQIAAVGTIVSSCYGFLCGAYMPISQFSAGIRKLIGFLPGTYATSLLRTHLMHGVLDELEANYLPAQAVEGISKSFDISVRFFDRTFTNGQMYLILAVSVVVLTVFYLCINVFKKKKA